MGGQGREEDEECVVCERRGNVPLGLGFFYKNIYKVVLFSFQSKEGTDKLILNLREIFL